MKIAKIIVLTACIIEVMSLTATGADRTWKSGATGNWSSDASWDNGHPVNNDSVYLNSLGTSTCTDDISNLTLANVSSLVGGTINGGGIIELTSGLSGWGYVNPTIKLSTAGVSIASGAGHLLTLNSVDLNGQIASLVTNGDMTINNMTGTGGFTKSQTGLLKAKGSYSGLSTIRNGTFETTGSIANTTVALDPGTTFKPMPNNSTLVGNIQGAGSVILPGGTNQLYVGGNNTSGNYSGTISGSGMLVKIGTGNLTLGGNNTYTGTTYVGYNTPVVYPGGTLTLMGTQASSQYLLLNGGVLTLGLANVINDSAEVNLLHANTSFNVVQNEKIGVLTGANGSTVNIGKEVTLRVAPTVSDDIYYGNITGSGSFFVQGTKTLRLIGTNTYAGSTYVDSGATLKMDHSYSISDKSLHVYNSGVLDLNIDTDKDLKANVESMPGVLIKGGAATLTLSGMNYYSGDTRILSGTVKLGSSNGASANSVVDVTGTFDLNGCAANIAGLKGSGKVLLIMLGKNWTTF